MMNDVFIYYRVKKENYAFLAESTTIEYTTERDCEVIRVTSSAFNIFFRKLMYLLLHRIYF